MSSSDGTTNRGPLCDASTPEAIFDYAFARITGSRPVQGNAVRLLKDATENYPVWLDAIAAAERWINFENYIIADDEIGRIFADALAQRARAGVSVRLLYDWFGSLGEAGLRYWARLRTAGVEVRAFNPPRPGTPLAWIRRDHRKTLTVDGRVAFVSGLCVARDWAGDPGRGQAPWRDTGIELRGPAIAEVEQAFAELWMMAGGVVPAVEIARPDDGVAVGLVQVRVIRGRPGQLSTYRLDQMIAAAARRTLWLTDAYFMATTAYIRTLTDANRDGVDVRLLVPSSSDVPAVQALVRASYRPLLERGIRIFEWNGPMLHAKTAVSDGRWARIGSSNANLQSWLTNWELDVTVEDRGFARVMEEMYLADLTNATEIVLDERQHVHTREAVPPRVDYSRRGSAQRLAAGTIALGTAAGAAISGSRPLSKTEVRVMLTFGLTMLVASAVVALVPLLVVAPLVVALGWSGLSLLLRAWRLGRGSAGDGLP